MQNPNSPAGPIVQVEVIELARDTVSRLISVELTIGNPELEVAEVSVTASSLNGIATVLPLPIELGDIGPDRTASLTLAYPETAAGPGADTWLRIGGTFRGGEFSVAEKVVGV